MELLINKKTYPYGLAILKDEELFMRKKLWSLTFLMTTLWGTAFSAEKAHDFLKHLEVAEVTNDSNSKIYMKGQEITKLGQVKIPELEKNIRAHIVLNELLENENPILLTNENLEEGNNKSPKKEKGGFFNFLSKLVKKNSTKDNSLKNLGEKLLPAGLKRFYLSRWYANEWRDLTTAKSWNLVPNEVLSAQNFKQIQKKSKLQKMAARFDVAPENMEKFVKIILAVKEKDNTRIDPYFLVPLWNWQDAPYLHGRKKSFIKNLSRDLINFVATSSDLDFKKIHNAVKDWVKATKITTDIEEYLRPKKRLRNGEIPLHFSISKKAKVNVNNIDLGIEYTGRFSTVAAYNFTRRKMKDGHKHWVETRIGMLPQERENVIKEVAQSLSKKLGNESSVKVNKVDDGGHGHGMAIAYNFLDPQGRKWRVEWDGINRSYDSNGKIIPGSGRAGHIELVTPKFLPKFAEMKAVEESFRDNDIIPSPVAGGGHVNIDLAPFKGNPRAFARFLSLFHEHRGIIALMFQNESRLKSAEPVKVSSKLSSELKNFNKSENELKKLLYNERYFNTRIGRKTRYLQLDITSYFQDVIPEKFIHDDFDILNPVVPWRPQFRVDPKVRKMEMRMMDAPTDAYMSAMQMKLVKALLNKAFNDDSALSGKVQEVSHQSYMKNPKKAFADLQTLTEKFGLSFEDYKGFLAEGILKAKEAKDEDNFNPLDERMKNYPKVDVWEKAVTPRTENEGFAYHSRQWTLQDGSTRTPVLPQVKLNIKQNVKVLKAADTHRALSLSKPTACFRRKPSAVLSDGMQENLKGILKSIPH